MIYHYFLNYFFLFYENGKDFLGWTSYFLEKIFFAYVRFMIGSKFNLQKN